MKVLNANSDTILLSSIVSCPSEYFITSGPYIFSMAPEGKFAMVDMIEGNTHKILNNEEELKTEIVADIDSGKDVNAFHSFEEALSYINANHG